MVEGTFEVSAQAQPLGSHRSLGVYLLPGKWPPAAPLPLQAYRYLSHLFPLTVTMTDHEVG